MTQSSVKQSPLGLPPFMGTTCFSANVKPLSTIINHHYIIIAFPSFVHNPLQLPSIYYPLIATTIANGHPL